MSIDMDLMSFTLQIGKFGSLLLPYYHSIIISIVHWPKLRMVDYIIYHLI